MPAEDGLVIDIDTQDLRSMTKSRPRVRRETSAGKQVTPLRMGRERYTFISHPAGYFRLDHSRGRNQSMTYTQ